MSDDKEFFLYGHMYHEDGTAIHITVNAIEARAIINSLITDLQEGHTPHFSVYGQLLTMADHLGESGGEKTE